jgi:hypothetical protein
VVKEKRYFAPTEPDAQSSGPAGGSELLGPRRSLEPKSTRRNRAPSRTLLVGSPAEEALIETLAGGEDYGYFASNAGGRRFESCHGNYARVAQWIEHLMFRRRVFPGLNKLCGSDTHRLP